MNDDNAIAPAVVNTVKVVSFDYDTLESETSTVIKSHTNVIREKLQRVTRDIVDIGERLTDVKRLLPHGQFTLWLQVEFNWDVRMAQNFMAVAKMLKNEKFSYLLQGRLDKLSIASSALYLLARPSTPEEVRREVLERAVAGEVISYSEVKQIVQARKVKRTPTKSKRRSTKSTGLVVGNWVRIQTKEGNRDWDGLIGEIVKPEEFGKVGVKLNETNWRCLRFFPEELTIVPALTPYRPGELVVIAVPKKVNCDYKQYSGCWAVINSITTSGNVELVVAGRRMSVMSSDIEPVESPPTTFKEVAQKVSQLLGLDELDDMDRQALEFLLRRQVFTEKQLYRLRQVWDDYFKPHSEQTPQQPS